jgi:hypothetical protein
VSKKFYREYEDDEIVYPLDYWIETAKNYGQPVKVELCKRQVGGDAMWCVLEGEHVYSSESCGKINCTDYSPRNGKNGRCTKLEQLFIGTGVFYKITENGAVRKIAH